MTSSSSSEREHAKRLIADTLASAERVFVIHYALQQLRLQQTELAPPVAAIAVTNLASAQTKVFSIKAQADLDDIDLGQTLPAEQMARLEYSLLFNFNAFLAAHPHHRFLHWYMRDGTSFGFSALEDRFRKVLAAISPGLYGERSVAPAVAYGFGAGRAPFPVHVEDSRRIDLARLIRDIHGNAPIGLSKLAEANGLSQTELIAGDREPDEFINGNYARLQWSITTKTRLIGETARLLDAGRLVVATRSRPRAPGDVRVFINYRREDSEGSAGRLHDKLAHVFGEDNVFLDTDDIPAGRDFEDELRRQIESCDVFLAVIGQRWASVADAAGVRRLDDPADFVRSEISAALRRKIPVIPVLVDGAQLPSQQGLPADIAGLMSRQKVDVRNSQFATDSDRLVAEIRRTLNIKTGAPIGASPTGGRSGIKAG